MSDFSDTLAFVLPFVAFAVLLIAAVGYSRALDKKLTAHLVARGFSTNAPIPSMTLDGIRLAPRLCLRGPVGGPDTVGTVGTIIFGFGRGPRRSSEAISTYTRRFFYICVALPPSSARDGEWLSRWTGTARAFAQPDGGIVVTWQLRDTVANTDRILREIGDAL